MPELGADVAPIGGTSAVQYNSEKAGQDVSLRLSTRPGSYPHEPDNGGNFNDRERKFSFTVPLDAKQVDRYDSN